MSARNVRPKCACAMNVYCNGGTGYATAGTATVHVRERRCGSTSLAEPREELDASERGLERACKVGALRRVELGPIELDHEMGHAASVVPWARFPRPVTFFRASSSGRVRCRFQQVPRKFSKEKRRNRKKKLGCGAPKWTRQTGNCFRNCFY